MSMLRFFQEKKNKLNMFFLKFLNSRSDKYILKGAMALSACYNSEMNANDIELESEEREAIEKICNDFAKKYRFRVMKIDGRCSGADCYYVFHEDYGTLNIFVEKPVSSLRGKFKRKVNGIMTYDVNVIFNDLMKEFATLYNADAATKYKMLTDDQKDAMSDDEVEEWEKKIKGGLLSKDETIGTLRTSLREMMNSSFEITLKDGTTKSLSLASFGIATGSYFSTEENERDVLHIDGDSDDSTTSGETDLLRTMISSDPQAVQDFFTELSKSLYGKLSDLMKGTEYSSSFTIYEDKLMASQYSAYNTKISNAQDALTAAQDKLYKKFATMETALSKINSSSNSLSGFFGGGN